MKFSANFFVVSFLGAGLLCGLRVHAQYMDPNVFHNSYFKAQEAKGPAKPAVPAKQYCFDTLSTHGKKLLKQVDLVEQQIAHSLGGVDKTKAKFEDNFVDKYQEELLKLPENERRVLLSHFLLKQEKKRRKTVLNILSKENIPLEDVAVVEK